MVEHGRRFEMAANFGYSWLLEYGTKWENALMSGIDIELAKISTFALLIWKHPSDALQLVRSVQHTLPSAPGNAKMQSLDSITHNGVDDRHLPKLLS
jgi:hypothetical protein